jgi:hypothetical protein
MSFKYNVIACCLFDYNSHRIETWIEYHKNFGIDHFVLYYDGKLINFIENFPEDYEMLQNYVEQGLVTLLEWDTGKWEDKDESGRAPNEVSGNSNASVQFYYIEAAQLYHTVAVFGDKARWIGNFSIDEFLVLEDYDNVQEMLDDTKSVGVKILSVPTGLKGKIIDGHPSYPDLPMLYPYSEYSVNDFLDYDNVMLQYDHENYDIEGHKECVMRWFIKSRKSCISLSTHNLIGDDKIVTLRPYGNYTCDYHDRFGCPICIITSVQFFHYNFRRFTKNTDLETDFWESSGVDGAELAKRDYVVNNTIRKHVVGTK